MTASLAKLTFDIAAAGASARLPEPLQRGTGVVKFSKAPGSPRYVPAIRNSIVPDKELTQARRPLNCLHYRRSIPTMKCRRIRLEEGRILLWIRKYILNGYVLQVIGVVTEIRSRAYRIDIHCNENPFTQTLSFPGYIALQRMECVNVDEECAVAAVLGVRFDVNDHSVAVERSTPDSPANYNDWCQSSC